MSNFDLTNEHIVKIKKILKNIKKEIKAFEEKTNLNLGGFKDEIIFKPKNCIKLIIEYVKLVHRIGTEETFKQNILQLMARPQIADLYIKALIQPDWVRVVDPIKSGSGEVEDFSPAWISRIQDVFVLFQDKKNEQIRLFDYLSYNMGEKINVIEYRKEIFAKFCKLCGLIVNIDEDGWPTKLSKEMVNVREHDRYMWTEKIKLIPFLSLLKQSMHIDVSLNLSYKFSILISWAFIIYYISNQSKAETCKAMNDILRSTETYLDENVKFQTNLDLFLEIVADFGRIVCIILYGNDVGFFPTEDQISKYKTYRSTITKILLKLTNELFNFTQNGLSLKEHQIVEVINNLRVLILI